LNLLNAGFTFSAAIRRGLIEAQLTLFTDHPFYRFSAAIRRGLIEAVVPCQDRLHLLLFSAAIRRGLIEAANNCGDMTSKAQVFRGDSPRPH